MFCVFCRLCCVLVFSPAAGGLIRYCRLLFVLVCSFLNLTMLSDAEGGKNYAPVSLVRKNP